MRSLCEIVERCSDVLGLVCPDNFEERFCDMAAKPPRYNIKSFVREIDVPDYVKPIIPVTRDYKLARKHLAEEIMALGLSPGHYELSDAKVKINLAHCHLRSHIEKRLAIFDRSQLIQRFIEQYDALLITERFHVQEARQSLIQDVDYDRVDAIKKVRKKFGNPIRDYRYLLEKVLSSEILGNENVTDGLLCELISLVDWYMVLSTASDVLKNELDIVAIEIDDSFVPEIFYSNKNDKHETDFAYRYAKFQLGIGLKNEDIVEGRIEELLLSEKINNAFLNDLGFSLHNMILSLKILTQAQRYGFKKELSLSYAATLFQLVQILSENIENLELAEANKIIAFLTLSNNDIRKLSDINSDVGDVPYWEHFKRLHRYSIRPIVVNGCNLMWGAEAASRAMNIYGPRWLSSCKFQLADCCTCDRRD